MSGVDERMMNVEHGAEYGARTEVEWGVELDDLGSTNIYDSREDAEAGLLLSGGRLVRITTTIEYVFQPGEHKYVGLGGCSCGWLADFAAEANDAYVEAWRAHVASVFPPGEPA